MQEMAGAARLNRRAKLELYPGTKEERMMELFKDWSGCKACELGKMREFSDRNSNIVFGHGNVNSKIVIVGEAPGEEEVTHSIPFVGKSGQLLNQIIAMTTSDPEIKELYKQYRSKKRRSENDVMEFTERMVNWRYNHFFITNAVACRPPENRTPLPAETKVCWPRVWNIIYIVDPIVIVACGNSAIASLTGRTSAKITSERGSVYDVEYDGLLGPVIYPVIPIYHPSYLLRKADWKVEGGEFSKTVEDWKKALNMVDLVMERNFGIPLPDRSPL